MARPKNTEQQRARIVKALLTVMSSQGYAKATIQSIAKQAELKSGLIHYHFKTKQDILIALVQQIHSFAQKRYEELAENVQTPEEKLKAFINARLAKGSGESPETVAAWVVIGTEAIRQPEVKKLYAESISQQRQILENLLKHAATKKLKPQELTHLASLTIAAIEGAFKLSVAAENVMPKGYAADALIELVMASIKSLEA